MVSARSLLVACAVILCSCDVNVFGWKAVAGGYYLDDWREVSPHICTSFSSFGSNVSSDKTPNKSMKVPRGYLIRTFRPRYEHAFMNLMALMDFDDWTSQKLDYNLARILPEGWFFALDAQT